MSAASDLIILGAAGIGGLLLWSKIKDPVNDAVKTAEGTVEDLKQDPGKTLVNLGKTAAETYVDSGKIVKQPAHLLLDLFNSDTIITGPAELLFKGGSALFDWAGGLFGGGSSDAAETKTEQVNNPQLPAPAEPTAAAADLGDAMPTQSDAPEGIKINFPNVLKNSKEEFINNTVLINSPGHSLEGLEQDQIAELYQKAGYQYNRSKKLLSWLG